MTAPPSATAGDADDWSDSGDAASATHSADSGHAMQMAMPANPGNALIVYAAPAAVILCAVVAVVLLGRGALVFAWNWLGWWHWLITPLLLTFLGTLAVLAWRGTNPAAPPPLPKDGRRPDEESPEVQEQLSQMLNMSPQRFALLVSRNLRRDGWGNARVTADVVGAGVSGGSNGTYVLAQQDVRTLVVRCRHVPPATRQDGNGSDEPARRVHPVVVSAAEVRDTVQRRDQHLGGSAVIVTTGDCTAEAREVARHSGVTLLVGSEVARWVLLGAAAWPSTARAIT